MDFGDFSGVLFGLFAAVGIFLTLRSRRKGGPAKVTEFLDYLKSIGIDASMMEQSDPRAEIGKKGRWAQKPMGTIKVKSANIDSVNVVGIASQYGVNYFIDYLVRISGYIGRSQKRKKTRVSTKNTKTLQGVSTEIIWKGDEQLAQRLGYHDYQLKDKLVQTDASVLKDGITIYPELKHQMARIRTPYHLPTHEFFKVIDIIAGHVKSEW